MAVSGNYLSLYVGGQRIALTKSNDFSQKIATEDMTTKDSQGFKEVLPTLKEASCSMEGICTSNLSNLLQFPENFENAAWIKSSATINGTRTADLNSQLRAQVLTWNSDTTLQQNIATGSLIVGNKLYFSIYVKGSGSINIVIGDDSSETISSTITLTSNWVRYNISYTLTTATNIYVAVNKVSGTAVSISMPQLEKDNLTAYKGSTQTLRDLQTLVENRTQISILYSDYFSGSFTTAYQGFLTDLSIKNAHDTLSTFTCNFQSTGTTTITTI